MKNTFNGPFPVDGSMIQIVNHRNESESNAPAAHRVYIDIQGYGNAFNMIKSARARRSLKHHLIDDTVYYFQTCTHVHNCLSHV